ncbi:LysM repeat-containing protein [Filimonas lacunae]|uniref:LysM repeat-containing protein n=2 Tax=Filimonas lacunae TaxID=477680 RepID=A0A173MLZ4_9BACT|nr:N-acetylmuramoyl-L-alanine amidase [Filimonas lacunae]SIT33901.1 LysM repeat-containing protein [Filimonas lacunae]
MNRIVVLISLGMFVSGVVNAQTKFTTHTITAGETLSGLSAKYKTTVGDIMRLNGMNSNSKLAIGQKIKIPAAGTSVPKPATPAATTPAQAPQQVAPASNGAATVHVVQQGETLYRIATKYHVKVDQVKGWNSLASDNVSVGQKLYINGQAPAGGGEVAVQQPQPTAPKPQPVQPQPAQQPPVQQAAPTEAPAAQTPEAQAPKPVVDTKPVVKEEVVIDPSKVGPKGYFEPLFGKDVAGRSLETASGAAMTFKTSSGWNDKKYYILMNDIAPGSIVKITAPASNKTIYAKVLWNMGTLKENEGLTYRISNAAADALGVTELKFQITVAYYD